MSYRSRPPVLALDSGAEALFRRFDRRVESLLIPAMGVWFFTLFNGYVGAFIALVLVVRMLGHLYFGLRLLGMHACKAARRRKAQC